MQDSLEPKASYPLVSIIIPVFNDAKRLQTCLSALESQTYPSSRYEIVVVDNGSDDDIEEVTRQFAQVSTAFESCPGSYAARNQGISLAKGEIIGFTDADCIPAPDWIERGVANLQRVPNCGLIAGRIELFFLDPARPTAVELYESIKAFPQKEYIKKYNYGATANVWTFKSVIDNVGVFDATLKSGGDREWGQRVFAAGYNQVYADDVGVAHPARHSLSQLYKKVVRSVGGSYDRKSKQNFSSKRFIAALAKDLRPPSGLVSHIFSDRNISGMKQKSYALFVLLLTRYWRASERIRLQLGGVSQRS